LVTAQLGLPEELLGVTEHVSDTWPVKPPAGVTVTVDVPDCPAVTMTEVPINENEGETGCAVKTTGTLTAVEMAPLTPVTVTVYVAGAVAAVETTLRTLVAAAPVVSTG
jgi:hypothetical protein